MWMAYSWERVIAVQGGITGLILSQGLWALAIEIPSTADESSSRGRGRSLPAVKFLFFKFAFQQTASLRWQIPQFMSPSCCMSPLMPQKLFPTNEF